MAYITLTFTAPLNESCQVGDTAYAVDTSSSGSFETGDALVTIGQIREITPWNGTQSVITCDTLLADNSAVNNNFILFRKDERVNLSSILGYYAETKFICDDLDKAELFSVSFDTFDSSK
jgi:hypothetical protein